MIFEIAGIRFAISGEGFPSKASAASSKTIDVHIRLQTETLPFSETQELLFENGTSLKVFQEGPNYRFLFGLPDSQDVLWNVLLNADSSEATVYAHATLRHNRAGVDNFLCEKLPRMLLIHFLAQREGWLFHAGAVDIHGKGYLFPGVSGTGKSTLARQFIRSHYGSILNDDRVVVRKVHGDFEAFGTPWTGDSGLVSDTKVPLKGIFFIQHGTLNELREISRADALGKLLPNMTLPWYETKTIADMLAYCEELIAQVPMYTLTCTADRRVVEAIKTFVETTE